MSEIREEELNMVNGGMEIGGLFGGHKFDVGDKVISMSMPDLGVGTVVGMQYNEGWHYNVVMGGRIIFAAEGDLEYPFK